MKEVLLSACASFILINVVRITRWLKVKPFTCEHCLAGWIACGWTLITRPWYEVPFWMAGSMVLAITITKGLKRL